MISTSPSRKFELLTRPTPSQILLTTFLYSLALLLFFQRWSKSSQTFSKVGLVNFFDLDSLIQPIDLSDLDQPFSSEEIDLLIKELPVDKAPSPDGFNWLFIKKCWPIIRDDFLALIREFYSGQANLRCLNRSFIMLVPKNQSPASINEYRPISLLGGPINIRLANT
jgi:hypothetical protein